MLSLSRTAPSFQHFSLRVGLTDLKIEKVAEPVNLNPEVAEQLRKSQENIENDVYGLDQKSPVRQPGEDPKYSLQMSKQHPTLHENKLLVLKSPPGKSDDKPSKVKIVARALEEVGRSFIMQTSRLKASLPTS